MAMSTEKRKKSAVIIDNEGICTDLDLHLPDLINVPAPRLSQHMISTFETFRSQMDLHSCCSRNDVDEKVQIENAGKESPSSIDLEVTIGKSSNESTIHGNKYTRSSQCITSGTALAAEESTKTIGSDNLLCLDRRGSKDVGLAGTSSSISHVANPCLQFTPSSARIGDIWKCENDFEENESECGSSISLCKKLVAEGDLDGEDAFLKQAKEASRDYNPFETPKKKKSPLISQDDYYYRSSSSEESEVEVLIKIPKMAFVEKVFDQLSTARPKCRVVAVDVYENSQQRKEKESTKEASRDLNRINPVPKPYTNIFGNNEALIEDEEPPKNFINNGQEFIVANSDDNRKGRRRPWSAFPYLHSKFDPSKKLRRRNKSKSSIADPSKKNEDCYDQSDEDCERATNATTRNQTRVNRPHTSMTNPRWTISQDSELIDNIGNYCSSASNFTDKSESQASESSWLKIQLVESAGTQTTVNELKNSATSPNPSIMTLNTGKENRSSGLQESRREEVAEKQRPLAERYSSVGVLPHTTNVETQISSIVQHNASASCSSLQATNEIDLVLAKSQRSESTITDGSRFGDSIRQAFVHQESISDDSTQTRTIPVGTSFNQPESSKASESELDVIEETKAANESASTASTKISRTLSIVNSWRNFTLSSEYSHRTLNAGYLEVILDTPQEQILSNYEREKGMKFLESQMCQRAFPQNSSKANTYGKRGKRTFNRELKKYPNADEKSKQHQKIRKGKQKNKKQAVGAGEHKQSHSSSSCFSLPDEPDIDVYSFPDNVKEGEFPFIVDDRNNSRHSNYYSSGDDIQNNFSDAEDRKKSIQSEKYDFSGKTTTSVKSSRISMNSVGASLPPKPRAIRSTRSMNSNSSMSPRTQKGRLAIKGKGEKLLHRVSSSTLSFRSLPCCDSSSYAALASSVVNSNTTRKHSTDSS